MKKRNHMKGFTLIELSVAIGLVTILLVMVALVMNEIIKVYQKGLSIKSVNQIGRSLIEEFSDTITQSSSINVEQFCQKYTNADLCRQDGAFSAMYQQFYTDNVKIRGSDTSGEMQIVPIGGVLCTGKYTYVWNTGYVLGDVYYKANESDLKNQRMRIVYKLGETDTVLDSFRLVKVEDQSRSICIDNIGPYNYRTSISLTTPPTVEVSGSSKNGIKIGRLSSQPSELLQDSDMSLALYDLVVSDSVLTKSSNHALYSASFILGTINGGINIMTESNFCQTPSNYSLNFSYCAVNKFNFTAVASGV